MDRSVQPEPNRPAISGTGPGQEFRGDPVQIAFEMDDRVPADDPRFLPAEDVPKVDGILEWDMSNLPWSALPFSRSESRSELVRTMEIRGSVYP